MAIAAGAVVLAAMSTPSAGKSWLPPGFVRLADIAPTIRQDMRYATSNNFTGKPVPGYGTNVCILARPAAQALRRVQDQVVKLGYSLAVFDCYRPHRATVAFMAWARREATPAERLRWHPRIDRNEVVPLGYISRSSSHSRGLAVDLTLVQVRPAGSAGGDPAPVETCRAEGADRALAGALEMGTGYDCFDTWSHTAASGITALAKENRQMLLRHMTAAGFANYRREWWHFTFSASGFEEAHDFPVQ